MKIEIQTIPAHWVAYRRVTCAHEQIGYELTGTDALPSVYEFARENLGECRAPFARFVDWRESDCDMQIGVQLAGPMQPSGQIVVDQYSACKAMVAEFIGPYAELPAAHSECDKFIEDNAHVLGGPCWEIYDGPPAEDGTAKTLIYYPIVP